MRKAHDADTLKRIQTHREKWERKQLEKEATREYIKRNERSVRHKNNLRCWINVSAKM